MVRAIISGESHEKTTRKLQGAFSVAEHNAATLVRTEKAHIMKEADFKAYEDIEIENYMYTALLDYVTCDICQSLDGMVFKTTQAREGENCPVMHPRCRCTTVADIGPIRRRRAKYPDGKYEIVDGSLTYKEWYNGLPQDKKDAINTARKKNSRKIADTVQYERYKKVLGNKVPKGFDKFQDLKYNDSEKWKELKALYRGVSNGSIIQNADGKYVEIVSHVSLTYKPNAITQKVGKQGGIERNYYDDTGKQFKQISNNNHGNLKLHPFGANGEHTHDYIWEDDKTVTRKDGRELTKTERKENGDIL